MELKMSSTSNTNNQNSQDDVCPCCLDNIIPFSIETLKNGTHKYTTIFSCKHKFHEECITNWAASCIEKGIELTCPLCKQLVFANSKTFSGTVWLVRNDTIFAMVENITPNVWYYIGQLVGSKSVDYSHDSKTVTIENKEYTIVRLPLSLITNTTSRYITLSQGYTPPMSFFPQHVAMSDVIFDIKTHKSHCIKAWIDQPEN